MRVIGGEFGGRKLKTPPGNRIRPTPDRLREALFNILAPRLAGKVFVDAYAGSGAVGIEALSRGAQQVIFIEADPRAARLIRENLELLGVRRGFRLVRARAHTVLPQLQADIVFLDPPYRLEREYATVLHQLGKRPVELVIVQHPRTLPLSERYGELVRVRQLRQGDNMLSFYEHQSETEPSREPPDAIPLSGSES